MRTPIIPVAMLMLMARTVIAQPVDTTKVSTEPLFTKSDAVVGGIFVVATFAAAPLDKYFADRIQNVASKENKFLNQTATFFRFMGGPGPLLIGPVMYGTGRLTKNEKMADLGLHGTEAVILGAGIITVVKGVAGRARPYADPGNPHDFGINRGWKHDAYRSFPSGHSLAGFAAASAVTAETHRWWPKSTLYVAPVMYGGAAMIGLSRMYNNKHWASDVVVGAGMGTFAGLKVVRYHHSHPHNRIDRWLLSASIVPSGKGGAMIGWSVIPTVK